MSSPLFSFGTSRGGTTFFARILSLNAGIKVASDPFLPLFRSFRTTVLRKKIDPEYDATLPLEDYYFRDKGPAMMQAIQGSSLDMSLPDGELTRILPELKARMQLAAEEVTPYLDELRGQTYREVFQSGLDILEKAYGAKDARWVGFNDNWVIEFLPILAQAFPKSKCIVVIRDPRAAMASSLKLRDNRPDQAPKVPLMYSFAHHWRRHAAFAYVLQHNPRLRGRILVVRYEDLVSEPERVIREICSYLGVTFDPSMLDTEKFRPLHGSAWNGHSNFDVPKKGIYTEGVSNWQSYLPEGTVESIEFLCDPEMQLFDYQPKVYAGQPPSEEVLRFLINDEKRCRGWRNIHKDWREELQDELYRKKILNERLSSLKEETIGRYFLFQKVYEKVVALN